MFTREDGHRTFTIERFCCLGVFFILMTSAFLVAVTPHGWFHADVFAAIDHWGRSLWPKLRHDAGILDALGPPLGTKFALFTLYCAGVTVAFLAIMLPVTWCAVLRSSQRLTYPQSSAIWKVPIALIVMIYLVVFDTWVFASDTSVGRSITHGDTLWFWTALLWGALSMSVAGAIIVVAKLWTHGQPENSYEYEQRKYKTPSP